MLGTGKTQSGRGVPDNDPGPTSLHESVVDHYSQALQNSEEFSPTPCPAGELKHLAVMKKSPGACSARSFFVSTDKTILNFAAARKPHPRLRCLMKSIPKEVMDKFYGCGAPLPLGIERLRVRAVPGHACIQTEYLLSSDSAPSLVPGFGQLVRSTCAWPTV